MSDHIIKISRSAASAVFSGREVALPEMLDARERRVYRQQQLLQEYGKPLICFTMNIAGPVKNSEMIRDGFDLGCEMLKANLAPAGETAQTGASSSGGIPVLFSEEVHEITGNEAHYVVDADPLEVKKITTAIEDGSDLGRLFDMDILRPDGTKVDRKELDLPVRQCLICGKPAKECGRSRTHSVEELQERTAEILLAAVRKHSSGCGKEA